MRCRLRSAPGRPPPALPSRRFYWAAPWALSARPDSLRAQVPLLQIARVLAALNAILPRGQHAMWLRTPRARFGGEAPLAMLLDGRAEALARELEGAVEGLPG